jgi:mRNA interferase RelE/StbE
MTRQLIAKRIVTLADDPRPHGVTKLAGTDVTYRLRQGDYRIIYNIYDELVVVEIIKIGHRSDVYRQR